MLFNQSQSSFKKRAAATVPLMACALASAVNAQTAPPKTELAANPPALDLANLGVFEKVYYQSTADGAIHAKGSNFKAMFNSAGLTYRPRGGEPISFTLTSATVGGQPLTIKTDSLPTRDGDTVSIDRGAFVEHFALTHNSIEQLFTIDQLPAHGDLVLRIATDAPNMIATTKSEGLEFKNENTQVTYSKAVMIDDAGAATGLSTQIAEGVIEIRVNAVTLNRAAFPITIDPVINSASVPFSYLPSMYNKPDVAYDATSNRFVLVAEFYYEETDRDIYSILLDANGDPVPNTFDYVDLTGVNWRCPRVANNNIANKFMVVAEHGLDGARGLWGCTIDPATGQAGTQFEVVAFDSREKINPDIGGDSLLTPPTYFLVVWENVWAADDHDIQGRLMNADGTPANDVFAIDIASTNQKEPSVSKSNRGAQWMVVWQTLVTPLNGDVWGARVNWNGAVTIPAQALNDNVEIHSRGPQVSSPMAGQYLVVYSDGGTSIYLQLLSSNMTTVDFNSLEELGNNTFDEGRLFPTVDADGDKFVVAYSEFYEGFGSGDIDVYVDSVCADNGILRLAEYHELVTDSGAWDFQTLVATTWSAGGSAMGPAVISWLQDTGQNGMVHVIGYDAPVSCCPADVAPPGGDGAINVADLLMIINDWDSTGWCYTNCYGDINGDHFVNVVDLLKVINSWGACQ